VRSEADAIKRIALNRKTTKRTGKNNNGTNKNILSRRTSRMTLVLSMCTTMSTVGWRVGNPGCSQAWPNERQFRLSDWASANVEQVCSTSVWSVWVCL